MAIDLSFDAGSSPRLASIDIGACSGCSPCPGHSLLRVIVTSEPESSEEETRTYRGPESGPSSPPAPAWAATALRSTRNYLSWKVRILAYKRRMIGLESEINAEMPAFVVRKVDDALDDEKKASQGSHMPVLGVSYKTDIDDLRESPALEIIHLLQQKGADVVYPHPFCPVIAEDGYPLIQGLPIESVDLNADELQRADAVVVVRDHSGADYQVIADRSRIVVDTRGVMRA